METTPTEGIAVAKRKLNIFFLLDKSGSMSGERIAKLNDAIPRTLDALKTEVQDDNPNLRILINVIEFSSQVKLVTSSGGEELDSYNWRDLTADGYTSTAGAINLLCEQLDLERMPKRGYPPVCVLVSDGYCTDSDRDYDTAIERLNREPWGKKAARIVVSIGSDIDEDALRRFVNKYGSYVNCENAEQIVESIRTKTTEASLSNSESTKPRSDNDTSEDSSTQDIDDVDPNDVF